MSDPAQSPRKSTPKRIFRGFWLTWIILLLASHIVRLGEKDHVPRQDQTTIEVPALDEGAVPLDGTVSIAYVDSHPRPDGIKRPVLFVLHGSPVASRSMMELHAALAESDSFRVITPDLPGFGGSSRDIPDYGVDAHAGYLLEMMDSLGIERAHFIGYSMAGGVVLEATHQQPNRVASLTMLSGIGVQELELLGDYHLNHGIHALQVAFFWSLTELVPHFGWLDDAILDKPYARNFFDTDQRPLRGILEDYEGPMLILHGNEDPMVPYQVGLEHWRVVPQSRLVTFEGAGHDIPFNYVDRANALITGFVSDVEADVAPTRSDADPDRTAAASAEFDSSDLPPVEGFALITLMFLIAIGTLASEDLTTISAGLMAARGTISLQNALIAAFVGILLGDIFLYTLGRVVGRKIVRLPPFSWFISESMLDRGAAWFRKKGGKVIIVSRFLPGTRFPTYVASGVVKAPFWSFLTYFLNGTIIWTPLIVGGSALIGNRILAFWHLYEAYALRMLVGLLATLYLVLHVGIPMLSHLGRRRWLSRWRRWTRWEFWPAWMFYPPLLVRVVKLMWKHRSMAVFTAANPAIPTGGFIGESKSAILDLLSDSPGFVARYRRIASGDDGPGAVASFMKDTGVTWPVVLKPDVGERGNGVWIAQTPPDVAAYFKRMSADVIVQEYVEGLEFGIFYVRHPSEETGFIFSVTEKRLLSVSGNGMSSLERLIWDDDRAVCVAPMLLRRLGEHGLDIPSRGERIRLVDVGTHCRGALFLDGSGHLTPRLEDTFDRIARQAQGFYFGRFDIRVPSREALERGEDFRIMELNGVSSEATHIYDPAFSFREAHRVLHQQWRLAFDIGEANRARGAQVSRVRDVVRLIFRLKIRPDRKIDTSEATRSHPLSLTDPDR